MDADANANANANSNANANANANADAGGSIIVLRELRSGELKSASRDTNVGQYSCSKKCFEGHEDLRFLMLVCKAF